MPSKTSKRSAKPMTHMVNARLDREMYDWLEAEADRHDENLSAALRRHLMSARLVSEAAKMRSDAELGVVPDVDPEYGPPASPEDLEALAAMLRRGTARLGDEGTIQLRDVEVRPGD